MQYLLLIYSNETEYANVPPEVRSENMGEWLAYTKAIRDSGQYVGADPLEPTSTATSVRVRDGQRVFTDGPFAETTEQLGGYYLVDVPDKAAALEWAARCPGARNGTIEVRAIMDLGALDGQAPG